MSTDALDFSEVHEVVRGAFNTGRLKLATTGAVFKSQRTGLVESIASSDISGAQWMRVARGFRLKIMLADGGVHLFDGFKEAEYEKLKTFISTNYDLKLEEIELCVKGWNWGTAKFSGALMSFEVSGKPAFELPLKDVSTATTGKNEVSIEFHRSEDAKVSLMEMRFHVPANVDDPSIDTVQKFHDQILAKADVIQATGDAIVTFEEVACLTPRGRYNVQVYPTFLQLHGKTYDYKIPHTTILRLFLLPHADQRFMFFVISIDPPIRQGQTRYPFLILQFERDMEVTCNLNLTEEEMETKYAGKLKEEMGGAMFEVVSRVLKEVCGRKITVPGTFKGKTGTSSISCSYKAQSGLLYPLERGFIFVHKPPVHVRFDEISSLNFARGSTTGRTFDLELELKNGTQTIFNNVPRDEYTPLFDFVNQKKLKIKNKGGNAASGGGMMDELIGSDDEDDKDQYLKQVKAEGASFEDDGSEDEDDEDFDPDKEMLKADMLKDVAEEYDSDVEMSDNTDDSDLDEDEKEALRERKRAKLKKRDDRQARQKRKDENKESGGGTPKKAGKSKGRKKKKDPNAPKRPLSSYIIFMNAHREQIKKDHPDASIGDMAKVGGELWKACTDKTPWEEKAKELKAQYEIVLAEYKKNKPESEYEDDEPEEKKGQKRSKSSGKSGTTKKPQGKQAANVKSAEFIDSSDSSGDDDEKKAPAPKAASPPPTKKAKVDEAKAGGSGDDSENDEDFKEDGDAAAGTDADTDGSGDEKPEERITSRRGKSNVEATKMEELPEDGSDEEEAELSEGSAREEDSSSDDDDDEED